MISWADGSCRDLSGARSRTSSHSSGSPPAARRSSGDQKPRLLNSNKDMREMKRVAVFTAVAVVAMACLGSTDATAGDRRAGSVAAGIVGGLAVVSVLESTCMGPTARVILPCTCSNTKLVQDHAPLHSAFPNKCQNSSCYSCRVSETQSSSHCDWGATGQRLTLCLGA